MSFQRSVDLDRALFEIKSVGALSKSHPWQSSLSNLGVMGLRDDGVRFAVEESLKGYVDQLKELDNSMIDDMAAKQSRGRSSESQHSIPSIPMFKKDSATQLSEEAKELERNPMWNDAQSNDIWASEVANLAKNMMQGSMRAHGTPSYRHPLDRTGSVQEGVEFASEIALFASSSRDPPAQVPMQVQIPPASAPAATDHMAPPPALPMQHQHLSHHSHNGHNGSVPRDVRGGETKDARANSKGSGSGGSKAQGGGGRGDQTAIRPFTSGRSLYVSDGGKFSPSKSKAKGQTGTSAGNALTKRAVPQTKGQGQGAPDDDYELPEELSHLDKALVQRIESDVISNGQKVKFDEIAGLEFAKKCVQELICWPILRPDLFTGLRSLPRGVLLFGPPGTGKTLIGKAISHEAGATFFSISASSLMSKWIGEGERTVKTLFAVACYHQPSVVFLDEVDSLLSARSSEENEASRRVKTEFLVQLDGAGTDQSAQVVIVGATNRPEELDEAARRRFVKRIYIPLPDLAGRTQLFATLLNGREAQRHSLTEEDLAKLVTRTRGFSGADVRALCTEAAMGPVRELAAQAMGDLLKVQSCDVRPISLQHFEEAMDTVQPTVSPGELKRYIDWNTTFGTYKQLELE